MQVERTLRPGQGGPQRPVLGLEDRDLHLQQLFGVHGGLLSVASTIVSRRISPACPERALPASAVFWYRLAGLFLASLRERD
jgi:hypothetical protein